MVRQEWIAEILLLGVWAIEDFQGFELVGSGRMDDFLFSCFVTSCEIALSHLWDLFSRLL